MIQIKTPNVGAKESTHRLRTLAALPGATGAQVPIPAPRWQLTVICNSSSMTSDTLFWTLKGPNTL